MSRGNLYTAFPFRYIAPKDGVSEQPIGSLEIGNTDRSITDALLSLTSPASLKIEVILASEPDTVLQVVEDFIVRSFEYDALSVRAPLTFEDIFSQRIPGDVYDPLQNPGLF